MSYTERYDRQLRILGKEGQEKLRSTTVAVVGLGGLGSIITYCLAAAGVGRLIVIDDGLVELSNLNRQILYTTSDIGLPKAYIAAARLRALNPEVEVVPHQARLTEENVDRLLGDADILVDALDNWETRHILNRYAAGSGKPLIHGAVQGFYAQVTTVIPSKGPCLACFLPEPPRPRGVIPIIGAVVGIVASFQASEVIKLATGLGEPLVGRLLVIDAYRGATDTVELKRNPNCPMCGGTH